MPRPVLALGTVALFVYAMWDPAGFTTRMQGLAFVPEPLWWLLGAVVSFYFGARELHYLRDGRRAVQAMASPAAVARAMSFSSATPPQADDDRPDDTAAVTADAASPDANPALEEWRRQRGNSG